VMLTRLHIITIAALSEKTQAQTPRKIQFFSVAEGGVGMYKAVPWHGN
jgi:hypothetical protein